MTVLAWLALAPLALGGTEPAPDGYSLQLIEGGSAPFTDPHLREPQRHALPPDGTPLHLELPMTIALPWGSYRGVEVSAHGWARLLSAGEGSTAPLSGAGETAAAVPAPPLLLEPFATPLRTGPRSRLLVGQGPGFAILRWYDFVSPATGEPAVFEILLDPGGAIRYQYYLVPGSGLEGVRVGYRIAPGPAVGEGAAEERDATALGAGRVLDLVPGTGGSPAGDLVRPGAAAAHGAASCSTCPAEPPWCDQARATNPRCTSFIDQNERALGCATVRANGYSCCIDQVSTAWHFRESTWCLGCSYTFYALVECGTEMHLPFLDMEGIRVRVTEVLSGDPIPITCQNQEYRDPSFHFIDCDNPPAGPGPEDAVYDAPAYNQSNSQDPTRFVVWGFDTTPSCQTAPENCTAPPGRGTLAVSPGEQQTVDCVLESPQGLCGIYRVEVESGGYDWVLLANCDGSKVSRFEIYDSCVTACAAYTPRPELAVSNLTNVGYCPAARLEFDLSNLGCAPVTDVKYRVTSDCAPPDRLDATWTGTLGANQTVRVSQAFPTGCTPATVTVLVDPLNDVPDECSESSAQARKCKDIPGQESVLATICVCSAALNPRAGADLSLCEGDRFTLDASASTAANCPGQVEYRWLEEPGGQVVCGWSANPLCTPPGGPFPPGARDYRLEQRCSSEPTCAVSDDLRVTVYGMAEADGGSDLEVCLGQAPGWILGGSPTGSGGSGRFTFRWSPAVALSSTGVPNPVFSPPGAGTYDYTVDVTDDASGCAATDHVQALVQPALVAEAGTDRSLCLGNPAALTLGGLAPSSTASGGRGPYSYLWTILAGASPSELTSTRVANPVYTPLAPTPPGGARFLVETRDAIGCVSTDTVTVEVAAGQVPGDLGNVLLGRKAGSPLRDVALQWTSRDPNAVAARVRRDRAKPFTGSTVVGPSVPGTSWTDAGALTGEGEPLHLYRVSGLGCSGVEGPY